MRVSDSAGVSRRFRHFAHTRVELDVPIEFKLYISQGVVPEIRLQLVSRSSSRRPWSAVL